MKVLLVDDSASIRHVIAEALTVQGYDVIAAESADVALTHLREVQIVITDINMPGSLDGIGLARHIKSQHPFLPIIIMSSEAGGVPDVAEARLLKPVRLPALVEAIRRLTAS